MVGSERVGVREQVRVLLYRALGARGGRSGAHSWPAAGGAGAVRAGEEVRSSKKLGAVRGVFCHFVVAFGVFRGGVV